MNGDTNWMVPLPLALVLVLAVLGTIDANTNSNHATIVNLRPQSVAGPRHEPEHSNHRRKYDTMLQNHTNTSYDYEDPMTNGGCNIGEIRAHIEGVPGEYCAPPCYANDTCPLNVPPNVTAIPICLLEDQSTHKKYCALTCTVKKDTDVVAASANQCGTATCHKFTTTTNVQMKQLSLNADYNGVCTYID